MTGSREPGVSERETVARRLLDSSEQLSYDPVKDRWHLDAAATGTFDAAWAEGRTATLEQAIQTALQGLPSRQ